VIPNPRARCRSPEEPTSKRARTFLKTDVFEGPATFANARDDFHQTHGVIAFGRRSGKARTPEGRSCRLFVIGHTHHARLLVDAHPDGGPLVTMDCGPGSRTARSRDRHGVPSAQFGVQCGSGSDLQLGPK
jgi:hypothetical protein